MTNEQLPIDADTDLAIDEERVRGALAEVRYPGLGRDLVSFGMVKQVSVCGDRVLVQLALDTSDATTPQELRAAVTDKLRALGASLVTVDIVKPDPVTRALPTAREHRPRMDAPDPWAERVCLGMVTDVIAVGAGKGGVRRWRGDASQPDDTRCVHAAYRRGAIVNDETPVSASDILAKVFARHEALAELNDALGIAVETTIEATGMDSNTMLAPPAISPRRVVELDVREDLRNGEEPFSKIMAAVAVLEDNQVLHLRTTFEPVPLFAVLEKRGFEHSALQHAADDWSVWFHGGAEPQAAGKSAASPAPPASATAPAALTEMRIDVRGLEPPEPLLRTLEALEALPAAYALLHVNLRVPQLLLPILRERGFDFQLDETRRGEIRVRIWRRSTKSQTTTQELAMSHQPVSIPTSLRRQLDVRPIAPRDKHPSIFGMFDSLVPGEAMILINDHDPKPLRYQFIAERPDTFEWTFLEEGPMVWRVRIARK